MKFKDLDLNESILKALDQVGYENATPIQEKAIPEVLKGRDLLGCAKTGTGKTASFALPIIQHQTTLAPNAYISALVLTPTRELALQIETNFKEYSAFLPLVHKAIFGGVPQGYQVAAIKKGVHTLIATPGRLMDLIQQKIVKLDRVSILVLDEADHMLDIGFIKDVKKVVAMLPKKRQTLFFSATMPKAIKSLADELLNDAFEVKISSTPTVELVQQFAYKVDKKEKPALLATLLKDSSIQRSIVFTRTKHGADRVVKQLSMKGISAAAIHGDKKQGARQKALQQFKDSQIRVLVATDIAARGIDIEELPHVVNYELPEVPETYVHRIGRTGRAGNKGIAISFCDPDQADELKRIEKLIGFNIEVIGEIGNGRDVQEVRQKKTNHSKFSKPGAAKPGIGAKPGAARPAGANKAKAKKKTTHSTDPDLVW